jgi:hypothetical protein
VSLRKVKTLLTEAAGTYTSGVWVRGTRTDTTVTCSAQPVVQGQDLNPMPEGRHMSDFAKFYSSTRLKVAADGEGIQPDIIVHEGYGYEIVSLDTNQSDVINHYKYIGVKVFKFTDTAAWAAGTLARP